jgi:hypothetical protein
MAAVAERLDRLDLHYAFVGGSIVNLLIDHPGLSPARPTDDVDVILEVLTAQGIPTSRRACVTLVSVMM